MALSISKKELAQKIAIKMNSDEKTATQWLDGITDTIYESFKEDTGVSIHGFGSFYLERRGSTCAFKFNPSQKLRSFFGWSSTYKGKL